MGKKSTIEMVPRERARTGTLDSQAAEIGFKERFLGLIQLRATPHKASSTRLPISDDERVDKYISPCLAFILILIAVILGEYVNLIQYLRVNTDSEVCSNADTRVYNYTEYYRNITGYYEALDTWYRANSTERAAYACGNRYYNCSSIRAANDGNGNKGWDYPFKTDSQDLIQECTEIKRITVCPGNKFTKKFGWNRAKRKRRKKKAFGCKSKEVEVPCSPTYVDPEGLWVEGSDWDYLDTNATVDMAEAQSAMTDFIKDLVYRINVAASVYCMWVALMIFIGPPFEITSPKMLVKGQKCLGLFKKTHFVLAFVIVWFCLEFLIGMFDAFVVDSDLWIVFEYAHVDPCFADQSFLIDLFQQAAETCQTIEYAENNFNQLNTNWDYYRKVEATYRLQANCVNGQSDTGYNCYLEDAETTFTSQDIIFPQNKTDCDMETFLQDIEPIKSRFNFIVFLWGSGALAGIFLQPILANIVVGVFQLFYPLSAYNGRILMPYSLAEDDAALNKNIKSFIRFNEFLPLLFHLFLFCIIVYNMTWKL